MISQTLSRGVRRHRRTAAARPVRRLGLRGGAHAYCPIRS